MGTCTVTIKKRDFSRAAKVATVDIALSTSYATGGDTVNIKDCELDTLHALELCAGATTPTGHALEVIHGATEKTAPLIRVRDVATGVEITAATNLSAQTVRARAYGNDPYV